MGWIEDWDSDIDDLLETFGEPVTWHHGAGSASLTAIVQRTQRGRKELRDGTEIQAMGTLIVKESDLPSGWSHHDTVSIPKVSGSDSTEVWAVASIVQARTNGAVELEIALGSARQYVSEKVQRR